MQEKLIYSVPFTSTVITVILVKVLIVFIY